jgi:peptidylprolyl isomerase
VHVVSVCDSVSYIFYLALDQGFILQDNLAKTVGALEELAVSEKFQRFIPEEYQSLPRLNKRATVEMKIRREDGSKFDVFGKLFDEVDLKMVVDGYNSPITAGNFVDLVNKGFYNDKKVILSLSSVLL